MYQRPAQGLYNPENEHDACGVGLVLQINGKKSHDIVERGLQVLENMEHRGAESADNKTGDGAGLMLQIPHEFILLQGIDVPERGLYGTGLVFLPKQQDEADACLKIIREKIEAEGLKVNFIGYQDLIKNKKASGRHRDLDDLERLEEKE